MLVLKRQNGEAIHINNDIKLTVYFQPGSHIRMGIEAPEHINIVREELLDKQSEKRIKP